ncbi:putative transcriptional regulator [Nocardioides thalensis]|uniref:Putative transcriptional regulator n=1 Tax=Nocardioides thalensis TaxID=1914755 RepID=A0A853C2D4_9ACTN|nr:hypothetical protein [Nocardioides thalensis]NYJ01795.1 putative transcriptional regulator [Nocardioides thalensis]
MDAMETVGDAMLHHPTVHPADLTVAEARAFFASSPKRHLLLLVRDDVLVGAVSRHDVETTPEADAAAPAASIASLEGRTTRVDVPVGPLRESMAGTGLRRIAVVDDEMHLVGLLCLKASLTGFCTDEGVAEMRRSRSG